MGNGRGVPVFVVLLALVFFFSCFVLLHAARVPNSVSSANKQKNRGRNMTTVEKLSGGGGHGGGGGGSSGGSSGGAGGSSGGHGSSGGAGAGTIPAARGGGGNSARKNAASRNSNNHPFAVFLSATAFFLTAILASM